ncbi:MAG: Smr/MutS family protein [Acidobacteriota bacterium]
MNASPVRIPIEGVLDLHTFSPKDVKILLPEYLTLCRDKGFNEVKIIHGKGSGSLKNYVRKQLEKIDFVYDFKDAELNDGGWGATIVFLKI